MNKKIIITGLATALIIAIAYLTLNNDPTKLSSENLKSAELAEESNQENPYEGSVEPYTGPNDIDKAIEGNPLDFQFPIE